MKIRTFGPTSKRYEVSEADIDRTIDEIQDVRRLVRRMPNWIVSDKEAREITEAARRVTVNTELADRARALKLRLRRG